MKEESVNKLKEALKNTTNPELKKSLENRIKAIEGNKEVKK